MVEHPPPSPPDRDRHIDESLSSVREALKALKFGNISLTVHEGRIVQIDVTEKKRLQPH